MLLTRCLHLQHKRIVDPKLVLIIKEVINHLDKVLSSNPGIIIELHIYVKVQQ